MSEPSRLDIIEIKLAHLEQSLQELGEVVMRQRREIEMLTARQQTLLEQIEITSGGGASAGELEKPPHY